MDQNLSQRTIMKYKKSLKLTNYPHDMDSELLRKRTHEVIKDLRGLLNQIEKRFIVTSFDFELFTAPAELIFSTIKEILLLSKNFFSWEHRDIAKVNPDIKIFYAKESFHGPEGTIEIDTGLPQQSYSYKDKPRPRTPSALLEEYFEDLVVEVIELERAYLKRQHNQVISLLNKKRKDLALASDAIEATELDLRIVSEGPQSKFYGLTADEAKWLHDQYAIARRKIVQIRRQRQRSGYKPKQKTH